MDRAWPISVLVLALSACGEPSSEQPADAAPSSDASADAPGAPTVDATPGVPDAVPDASPDAALPPRGRVTLHALTADRYGRNAEGANVLFHDPDGSLVSRATTDADGNAEGELRPGGSVTVHWRHGDLARFLTLVDVDPGDHLRVGLIGAPFMFTTTTQVAITPYRRDIGHLVYNHCDGTELYAGEVSGELAWREDCDRPRRDYVLTTTDHAHYMTLLDQPQTDRIRFSGPWTASRPTTASYSGLPDDTFTLAVWRTEHLASGVMIPDHMAVGQPGRDAAVPFNALDLGSEIWIHTTSKAGRVWGRETVALERAPVGGDYTLDGTSMLPLLTNAVFDRETTVLSWDAPAAAREADAAVIDVTYGIFVPPSRIRRYTWRVIAPASTSSVRFPSVPVELERDAPLPDVAYEPYVDGMVVVDDSDDTSRGLRSRLDRDLDTFGPLRRPRSTGRIRMSYLNCGAKGCD